MIPLASSRRMKFHALAAVAALALGLAPLAARAQASDIDFQVDLKGAPAGEAQLQLTAHRLTGETSYGRGAQIRDLQGLDAGRLAADQVTPVRFRVIRDAGTFACDGSGSHGHASGVCQFQPNGGFAQYLRSRGAGEASNAQLMELAMSDTGVALLDELRREHYPQPDVADLVRAGQHGISMTWLTGMDSAGYRLHDVGELVHVRDHGITPRYVAELKAAGYRNLSADDLVHLRDHGVSSNFLKTLAELGYAGLPAGQVAQLRDHGVSEGFLRELDQAGYRRLPAEQLIRLRDHGVSVGFIQKVNSGGPRVDLDEVIRMRDRGER